MENIKKILIIDDEESIRQIYHKVFSDQGFSAETAVDGQEGLLKAAEWKPDIILLDIMLPKMSGLDVLKSLKNNNLTKSIPVLLLTNIGDESVIKDGFKYGASGYFLKVSYSPYQVVEECKKYIK